MSSSIILGTGPGTALSLDLKKLIDTRMLIQANSGGGKSRLLRRLLEQSFGKVQAVVLDPEGEFATLREKHDFLLVGKGGEIPAEPRAASLLAKRLLELRVSAVVDLYDLRLHERRSFVRQFLEALVTMPKELYRPLIVAIDEAHSFVPERSSGEAESTDAVIALLSQGRKRGLCGVLLTQRLSKLHKDAAAECNNVCIGRTWLDVDQKRAGDVLGLSTAGDRAELRDLEAGQFLAFGPAFSAPGVTRFHGGQVRTTHPTAGTRHKLEAPAPSAAIRKVVAELRDLPEQAAEEIRTLEQAQAAVRELKRALKEAKAGAPQRYKQVTVSILKPGDAKRLTRVAGKLTRHTEAVARVVERLDMQRDRLAQAQQAMLAESANMRHALSLPRGPAIGRGIVPGAGAVGIGTDRKPAPVFSAPKPAPKAGNGHSNLTGPERKLLVALAQHGARTTRALALLAGYAHGGGAFRNPLSALRSKGYAEGRDTVRITEDGLAALGNWDSLPTGSELLRYWLDHLPGPERKLLNAVAQAWPGSISVPDLAATTEYEAGGGAFRNPLSRLRTLGLVHGRGELRAAEELCS